MFLSFKYTSRSLILCVLFINLSKAHVRMICPRPVSPRSDISSAPMVVGQHQCQIKDETEQNILEVHPGLFTFVFEETDFMAGSPFRVLLFTSSSSTQNVKDRDQEKRDLRRNKRDASDSTTESSITLQAAFDVLNGSLHSIPDTPKESASNDTSNQGVRNNSNTVTEKPNEMNHTDSTAKAESTSMHVSSTESVPKDSTTQKPEVTTRSESDTGEDKDTENPDNSQSQSCVLLDHIPHNDEAVITCSAKERNAFPLGVCDESTYYVTIRIPDIFCPDCFLVVQQIKALKDHKICDVSSVNGSDCVSYISCARINIRPSTEGMSRNLSYCSNYLDNLPDDWAYRPQDIYEAGGNAVMTMDLLHGDLHLEITRGLSIGPPEKVEIRHNRAIIWNASTVNGHINADAFLLVWNKVPEKYQTLLKENKLVLNIIGSKKSKAVDITFKNQIFSEGKLAYLHDIYSSHGWLIAKRFLGPTAKDPMAALPIGPCAPPARHFLAFFEAVDAGDHGLLGMSILENRAYITAVLHVNLGTVMSIKLKGSELVGAKDIVVKVPETFSGVFQVALDVTQQVKFLDTVQFLKTVEVKTNREDAIMVGALEEGFYSVLRDEKGRVQGMGAFQPTQGYWMRAEIVLTDLSDSTPKLKKAKVLGSHIELMDLSKETIHCTKKFCCLESYVHELNSELFLHLLSGQARVEVATSTDVVSGQIVGSNNCSRNKGLCLITEEMENDNGMRTGLTVNAVILLDRAEVIEISVQVDHPPWGFSGNYTTHLTVEGGPDIKIPLRFHWISEEQYTAKARYPLANSKKMKMMHDKEVYLKVSNDNHTLIADRAFTLKKMECIQSKIHVVGQDKSFWSPVYAPYDVIYAVVLDHLKFMYDNTTSLYIMPSKASFQKCDFSKAKEIKGSSLIDGITVQFYKLTSPGRFYFADNESCLSSSPAKLVVQVVKGKESLVQDRNKEDWCQTSFYMAWREEELSKWDPPSVSGPVVLGLFLGLTTGIGFLLWQGMKMKQMPSHSASSSRNSLSHFVRF